MAIDDAVSLRLLHWDNDVKKNDANIMANAIWGGDNGGSSGGDYDSGSAEVW